nr:class F sortase [Nocardioides panaciterrulae]
MAVAVLGAVLVTVAVRDQQSAPSPRAAGRVQAPTRPAAAGPDGPGGGRGSRQPVPLGPSRPVRIAIPAIGVDSPVNPIGLAEDGSLAVPQPGPRLDEAAWFENSPTPGQPGPAIIEGHVDSPEGPSVFFRLGAVKPGEIIRVWRADGIVTTFRINAVRDFSKASFPTQLVYGGDLSAPTLRLITCSDFNTTTHHHEGNEVVFAHLVHHTDHPGRDAS